MPFRLYTLGCAVNRNHEHLLFLVVGSFPMHACRELFLATPFHISTGL